MKIMLIVIMITLDGTNSNYGCQQIIWPTFSKLQASDVFGLLHGNEIQRGKCLEVLRRMDEGPWEQRMQNT